MKQLVRALSLVLVLMVAAPAAAQQGEQRPVSAAQAGEAKVLKARADKIGAIKLDKLTKKSAASLRAAVVDVEASARALRVASAGDAELARTAEELGAAASALLPIIDRYIGETEKNVRGGELEIGVARVRDGLATVLGKLGR